MQRLVMLTLFALTTATTLRSIAQSSAPSSTAQSSAASSSAPTVHVANGTLEGITETSGVRSFKGIPFAAPPVGNLRWREPQPAANWEGVRKADHFAARGMQLPLYSDMQFRSAGMSEDCLYLNVWQPAEAANGKKALPVLVYFYGGGFVAGDGSEYRYDGESMATKGIVAVTVTYRLGVFGFFAHPELTRESPHHASGNYALLDQAAALKWVQQNIKAFGGDPKRVTIAGESAGSVAVSALMASPLSRDLIAGAIGESGSVLGTLSAAPLDRAEHNGEEFVKASGANSLADMRAMSAGQLLQATKGSPFRFSAAVDGYFFPKSPYAIFAAGEQAHVPLLVGWNSEESNSHAILGNDAPTRENFEKAVKKLYGDAAADSVLQVYRPASDAEVQQAATELATDRFIALSTWKWADMQIKTGGGKPVYRYYYERPRPGSTGASHSAEIEYAMGNLPTNKVYAWTPDDFKVSATLQGYFANFIKSGNPNGPGLPEWPAANGKDTQVMHVNVDSKALPDVHRDRYLFMDSRVSRQ